MEKPFDFENMSRDELVKCLQANLEYQAMSIGDRRNTKCPFCDGIGYVDWVKCEMRDDSLSSWKKEITVDEYKSYLLEKQRKMEEFRESVRRG